MTAAEIVLTDTGGGVTISMIDPAFTGDIFVSGMTSATLSGHLVFV